MTFIVFRTSSPMYEREGFEKYPCDGAYIVDHRPTFVDGSGNILYDNTYELEVDSLSDLVDLSKIYGEIIIDNNTLEIYDDFRE